MATYVLIHGASHGGWCWHKVVPLLEGRGHTVMAPDLPGHGADATPPGELSLDAYADHVAAIVEAAGEPVKLVGHSLGGLTISAVAERTPERIDCLVYLAALLPTDGVAGGALLQADKESIVGDLRVPSEDGVTVFYRPEGLVELFYADCSDADVVFARARLVPEPAVIARTPARLSAERFGRVRRAYIVCLRDRAISAAQQRAMIEASPCDPVMTLDTSHSPFLSAPEDRVARLESV
jgi:pimeloyl-ACP methyl ester carboxylesterase